MLSNVFTDHLMQYRECFATLQDAMKAIFHYTLDEAYLQKIENFTATYKAIDISTTTKVHLIKHHTCIPEFIQQ